MARTWSYNDIVAVLPMEAHAIRKNSAYIDFWRNICFKDAGTAILSALKYASKRNCMLILQSPNGIYLRGFHISQSVALSCSGRDWRQAFDRQDQHSFGYYGRSFTQLQRIGTGVDKERRPSSSFLLRDKPNEELINWQFAVGKEIQTGSSSSYWGSQFCFKPFCSTVIQIPMQFYF